jgi:PAS domain S-box-containing protein
MAPHPVSAIIGRALLRPRHPHRPPGPIPIGSVSLLRRLIATLVFLAGFSLVSAPVLMSQEASPASKAVLILYDENPDFSGLMQIDRSIKAVMSRSDQRFDIFTEFMDHSRFQEPGQEAHLRDFFREKYRLRKIDLIIAVMKPSLDFFLAYGAEVFPATPIVFCGIDPREIEGRTLGTNVTGVLVKREFKPTLDLALRLQPDTREVVLVAGAAEFNKYWLEKARQELSELQNRVAIRYLTDLPLDDVAREVSHLPPHTVILYLHVFKDVAGQTFTPLESLSRITSSANRPIYVFFDQYLDHDVVGGHLYSFERHAANAAALGLRILHGENASDIPVSAEGTNVTMLDERQLRRWGIDLALVPPGAIVMNRSASFWGLYKEEIIGSVLLFVAEGVLIFGLLAQRTSRRRVEAELRRNQDRLTKTLSDANLDLIARKQLAESLQASQRRYSLASAAGRVGVWDMNLQNRVIYVDPELKALLGYRDEEIGNHADEWVRHLHPDDLNRVRATVKDHLEGRVSAFAVEFRMRHKDGGFRWMLARGTVVDGDEGARHILGAGTDITERKRAEDALRASEQALQESHARIEDLAGRLLAAQEEERRHIARELHDDLNQEIAALGIGIGRLKHRLPEAEEAVHEEVTILQRKTAGLSRRVRRLSHELHSSILQHAGLAAALKGFCQELAEEDGVDVTLNLDGGFESLSADTALCLYRVAQESLQNVVKHSGADSALVALTAGGGGLELLIADEGVGFDLEQARLRSGLGLVSMEERIKLVHGSLNVTTRPGQGTRLKVWVPFRPS